MTNIKEKITKLVDDIPATHKELLTENALVLFNETNRQGETPQLTSSGNGSIAFTWTHYYPTKEFEIWLFDKEEYYAEYLFVYGETEIEGTALSLHELLNLHEIYTKL